MLESGWWDGVMGDTRGWFPSNFVEEVEEEDEASGPAVLDVAEEALRMDDALGVWDIASGGLDDLAREMMDEGHVDDGMGFQMAARSRAAWASRWMEDIEETNGVGGHGRFCDDGRRRR